MKPIRSALKRRALQLSGGIECLACGGSGIQSKGGLACVPCRGTGSIPPLEEEMIQHNSDTYEHYTPSHVVALIRQVMGDIDLDPASCESANEIVRATAWYGPGSPFGEDGLSQPWLGRVYLNPPGGTLPKETAKEIGTTSRSALWWAKLADEWHIGNVEQAIFMGFTLEILRTVQSLPGPQPLQFPFCIPSSRLSFGTNNRVYTKGRKKGQFIDPDKDEGVWVLQNSPAHANVIVYLPPIDKKSRRIFPDCLYAEAIDEVDKFHDTFLVLGQVKL